jgi:cyclohexanecarboxylate-CoA ligase
MLGRAAVKALVVPAQFRGFDHAAMAAELVKELTSLRSVIVVGGEAPEGMHSFDAEVLAKPWETGSRFQELKKLRPDPFKSLAQVAFTSGTTGEPKGVMHIMPTLLHAVRGMISVLSLGADDVILMASTLGHQTGFLYGFLMPIMLGAKVVYMDIWNAERAAQLIAEEGVTFNMGAVPFLVDFVRLEAGVLSGLDLSCWRYFVCAGAPIPPTVVEQAHERLPCRVISAWGMTENGAVTMIRPQDPPGRAAESDGGPIPGMEVRVVDPQSRRPLPPGREGLLLARGPAQFVGYFERPDLWEAAHDAEGWFDTGDLARMEPDGYIRITGRLKEIIIRGGENIPVTEVEDILLRHPSVAEVAAVGYPDPRLGERVCACVVLRPGAKLTLEDVQTWFAQHGVAKQYWPERLELLEQLPRTPAGKVQKYLLKEWVSSKLQQELGV